MHHMPEVSTDSDSSIMFLSRNVYEIDPDLSFIYQLTSKELTTASRILNIFFLEMSSPLSDLSI